jgi:segregation and condensation protein B
LLLAKPQSLERLYELLEEAERPSRVQAGPGGTGQVVRGRAFELKEVASGYRLQIREDYAPWVGRLWEERPQRYSVRCSKPWPDRLPPADHPWRDRRRAGWR